MGCSGRIRLARVGGWGGANLPGQAGRHLVDHDHFAHHFGFGGPAGRRIFATSVVSRRAVGPSLVLLSSAAIQLSAAPSVAVFASVGALVTSGARFSLAAIILLAVARPRLRKRSGRSWASVIGLGVAMAG